MIPVNSNGEVSDMRRTKTIPAASPNKSLTRSSEIKRTGVSATRSRRKEIDKNAMRGIVIGLFLSTVLWALIAVALKETLASLW